MKTVILINGAFGIGKTTAAGLIKERLPHSIIVNPEHIGFVLQRMYRLAFGPIDDFQDLMMWRRLTAQAVRAARGLGRTVIVPMAISNSSYLAEIVDGIERFGHQVHHYCLTAPVEVVAERIRLRAAESRTITSADIEWQLRRAAECCQAHKRPEFATHIPVGRLAPNEVADTLLKNLAASGSAGWRKPPIGLDLFAGFRYPISSQFCGYFS
jgi:predicted ABC-type ATPase